jgi:hypothetical protein
MASPAARRPQCKHHCRDKLTCGHACCRPHADPVAVDAIGPSVLAALSSPIKEVRVNALIALPDNQAKAWLSRDDADVMRNISADLEAELKSPDKNRSASAFVRLTSEQKRYWAMNKLDEGKASGPVGSKESAKERTILAEEVMMSKEALKASVEAVPDLVDTANLVAVMSWFHKCFVSGGHNYVRAFQLAWIRTQSINIRSCMPDIAARKNADMRTWAVFVHSSLEKLFQDDFLDDAKTEWSMMSMHKGQTIEQYAAVATNTLEVYRYIDRMCSAATGAQVLKSAERLFVAEWVKGLIPEKLAMPMLYNLDKTSSLAEVSAKALRVRRYMNDGNLSRAKRSREEPAEDDSPRGRQSKISDATYIAMIAQDTENAESSSRLLLKEQHAGVARQAKELAITQEKADRLIASLNSRLSASDSGRSTESQPIYFMGPPPGFNMPMNLPPGMPPAPPPLPPGPPPKDPCYAFIRGKCTYGANCKFTHDRDAALPQGMQDQASKNVCFTFQKSGNCKFGAKCHFMHGGPSITDTYNVPPVCRDHVFKRCSEPCKNPGGPHRHVLPSPRQCGRYFLGEDCDINGSCNREHSGPRCPNPKGVQ